MRAGAVSPRRLTTPLLPGVLPTIFESDSTMTRLCTSLLLVSLLALGGCQSSGQSNGGLVDGSAAPPVTDLSAIDQGPDGDPDECAGAMSEGTSMTPGC